MQTPDPILMELYGTEAFYLEKTGALAGRALEILKSLATMSNLRAAAGAGSVALALSDKSHVEQVLAEAEAMNQTFRMLEQGRMAAVIEGFSGGAKHASVALDPEIVKIAEAVGRRLAHEEQKQAGIMAMGANAIKGLLKPAATAVAGAAPAAAEAVTKAKPLISGWTKAKIGLGATAALGTAGVGYAGLKGAQGARDYMMQPGHSGGQWGSYGPIPQANVGSGGYTQPIM